MSSIGLAAIGADLLDIEMPAPRLTALSEEDEAQAVASFKQQHDAWLAVKTGRSTMKVTFRRIKDGEYVPEEAPEVLTGSLAFRISPAGEGTRGQSPVKVDVRLTNNQYGCSYLVNNVFSRKGRRFLPNADGVAIPPEARAKLDTWGFRTELLFFPLDFMAKSYKSRSWSNVYTRPEGAYFSNAGLPWRRSTEAETATAFKGEPQYLFLLSPGLTDADYWFSTVNGEFRQVDVRLPRGVVKSFRYEDYVKLADEQAAPDEQAAFPSTIVASQLTGSGAEAHGWEVRIKLESLQINVDLPDATFLP